MPAVPPVPAEHGPARPRRRGRLALLLGTAAALGLVAGTCGGYLVQADREPTRLPSLAQPVAQAKGKGPAPLTPATDRRLRVDGDLRDLLLKKPSGAAEADWLAESDGWLDLTAYADSFTDPQAKYTELVTGQFRRAAITGWAVGDAYTVEIRLIQYRQEETLGAADSSDDQHFWSAIGGVRGWPLPGSGNGKAYVATEPDTEDGYAPVYRAEAHAWRGDVAMEIWIYGSEPIKEKTVMGLAERQLERL